MFYKKLYRKLRLKQHKPIKNLVLRKRSTNTYYANGSYIKVIGDTHGVSKIYQFRTAYIPLKDVHKKCKDVKFIKFN